MAVNGIFSYTQPLIPIFNGEKYEFWSIKMKTLFKFQDVWELVEKGVVDPATDEVRLKEIKKKDNKALFSIQQAIHETMFSQIAAASTFKKAWEILQKEYQGTNCWKESSAMIVNQSVVGKNPLP
ncbi:hypothetical protein MANES_07G062460v8 [Manihot esculenta]|uniref:Uncharacterized protein n=1 Tax=Manihot esculenta TaxID=3983 RepID=A0ACB7HDM5_MANES|nr:hypothetical protein MANES_07G062460v8 [Manihot esculenta]